MNLKNTQLIILFIFWLLFTSSSGALESSSWTMRITPGVELLTLIDQGRWDEAWAIVEQGLEIAEDPQERVFFLTVKAKILLIRQQPAGARSTIKEALKLTKEPEVRVHLLRTLGDLYLFSGEGQPEEALAAYEEAQALTLDPEERAALLNKLGVILRTLNRLEEAEERFKEALTLATKPENRATYHSNLGFIYYIQGRLEEALTQYQDALRLTEKPNEKAAYLQFLGEIFRALKRWEEARAVYLSLTQDPETKLLALLNLGELSHAQGQLEVARMWYEEVLQLIQDPEQKAAVLNVITVILTTQGKLDEAWAKAWEALALTQDPEQKGIALSNLGAILRAQGKLEEAQLKYKQALMLIQSEAQRGAVLNNLGDLFRLQGRWEEAQQKFEDALDLLQDEENRGKTFINLCLLFYEQGEFEKARGQCEKAVGFVKDRGTRAFALNNLGLILSAQDQLGEARVQYEKANELAQNPDMKGTILNNLGSVLRKQGKLEEAEAKFVGAIALKQDPESKAWSISNLADIFIRQGRLEKAMKTFQEGLALVAEDLPPGTDASPYPNPLREKVKFPLVAAGLLIGKGETLELLADREPTREGRFTFLSMAREALLFSVELIEVLRAALLESETKVKFMLEHDRAYEVAIRVDLKLHGLTRTGGYDKEAFHLSERARARAFLDQLQQARAKIEAGVDPNTLRREQELGFQLNLVEKQLLQEETKGETKDPAQIIALQDKRDKLKREYRRLIADLEKHYPRYAALKYPRPLTGEEVQALVLKEGEALLEYFVGELETYLFVMDKNHFYDPIAISLTNQQLRDQVEKLREPFEKVKKLKSIEALKQFNLQRAHELYQQLMQRAEDYNIKKATVLIVVPHGSLYYLPFELLVTRVGQQIRTAGVWLSEYEDSTYVLEHFPPLVYAPSASVLNPATLLKDTSTVAYKGKLLAFAYGVPSAKREASEQRGSSSRAIKTRGGLEQELGPLKYSETEVEEVASLYQPHTSVYVGARGERTATEARAKAEAPYYRHLLFSTHGILDDQHPMYSTLVFPGKEPDGEDGLLETFEVFNLSLHAELVTLSACELGLGRLKGGEGIVGMTRAFLYAGAPTIVASLWSVADQSTAELVIGFYKHLAISRLNKAAALKSSKLALRQRRETIEGVEFSYAHPFFWAPFILVGER